MPLRKHITSVLILCLVVSVVSYIFFMERIKPSFLQNSTPFGTSMIRRNISTTKSKRENMTKPHSNDKERGLGSALQAASLENASIKTFVKDTNDTNASKHTDNTTLSNKANDSVFYTSEDVREFLATIQSKKRFPDCLIIGSRKAGTTALRDFLSLHPNINALNNEPQFFNHEDTYRQGLQSYISKLPLPRVNQVLVEKSAEYFHYHNTPMKVHAFNSSIKLILIVRDPFVRMYSDYLYMHRVEDAPHAREKRRSMEELLVKKSTGEINEDWQCLYRSLYSVHFKEWLRYFPRHQIHVVDGDDFAINNPARELQKIETFLNIKSFFKDDTFHFNEAKGYYCFTKCYGGEKGHLQPELKGNLEEKARMFFKPYNKMFYDLVGVDFGWK